MTFDLEKARAADEALPYPLDAKEIWISRKGQMHINLPNAPSIFFTLSDLCEFRNIFHGQAAEIERLRAALDESEQILAHKTKTATHWYEEGLKTRADLVQSKRVVEQQAAKIRELEDVHKRSGVKYAKIINELRSSVYANIPGLKKQWDEILNAPANGKIGPDADAKPHCWQITEERKAAIRDAEIALRDAVLDSNDPHCWDAETAVLRAMLEEAEQ